MPIARTKDVAISGRLEQAVDSATVVLASLTGFVASMQKWDPFQFVDWCEEAASGSMPTDAIEFLRSVQLAEIRNLLDYSVEHAGSADRRT